MKTIALLSVFLLVLPLLFQYFYGKKAVHKMTSLPFGLIVGVSVVSHIVFTFLGLYLVSWSIIKTHGEYACGTPATGIIPISGILFFILMVVIVIQSNKNG